jgi:hypothetical protein
MVASCWAIGRNSVDATNALLIRTARGDGRRFRLRLTVFFLPYAGAVFFAVEVFFDDGAVFWPFWEAVEAGFVLSANSEDCAATGMETSNERSVAVSKRAAAAKTGDMRDRINSQ